MTTALYETDFYSWALRQADLLRSEDYADLDLENLIEEIESMGRSERNQLENRLHILLIHLLKFTYDPTGEPSRGWAATIREQRRRINRLLKNSPSLRNILPEILADVYTEAREDATYALDEPTAEFLAHCPWTPEQILDLNWLP